MVLNWIENPFIHNLQLDIVGFLAILGEGSVQSNLQVSTQSKLILVPRLIPAPQVFLRPTRTTQLERSAGNVTGVHSGNDKDYINYFGHIVLDAEGMPDYSVRCVKISKDTKGKVKAKTKAPLSALVFLGAAESIAILGVSIYNKDGLALVAVVLFSFLSTLCGLANLWTLSLPKRREPVKLKKNQDKLKPPDKPPKKTKPPPGDVVIRYPNGSFLVVECEEEVARELYFAPENVFYLVESPWVYRLMSLAGTLMLMLAIVALGNSGNVQQIVFAGSYMLLNAGYWIVAALPPQTHWDLSGFIIQKQRFQSDDEDDEDSLVFDFDPDLSGKEKEKQERKFKKMKAEADATYTDLNPSFTYAMWKAIVATKSISWVKKNDALPETPVWHQWLLDALKEANKGAVVEASSEGPKTYHVPDWDPLDHWKHLHEEFNRASMTSTEKIQVASETQNVPPIPTDAETREKEEAAGEEPDPPFIPVSPRRQGTGFGSVDGV